MAEVINRKNNVTVYNIGGKKFTLDDLTSDKDNKSDDKSTAINIKTLSEKQTSYQPPKTSFVTNVSAGTTIKTSKAIPQKFNAVVTRRSSLKVNNITGKLTDTKNQYKGSDFGKIVSATQQKIAENDDMGSQTVGGVVTTAQMGYEISKGTLKTAKTVKNVGVNTVKGTVTVTKKALNGTYRAVRSIKDGTFKVKSGVKIKGALKNGLKSVVKSPKQIIKKTGTLAKNTATVTTKGAVSIGKMAVNSAVASSDNIMLKGAKNSYLTGKYAVKGVKVTARSVKTTYRVTKKVYSGAKYTVKTSYNIGQRAVKGTYTATKYTVRTAKTAGKTVAKTTYKAGKATAKAVATTAKAVGTATGKLIALLGTKAGIIAVAVIMVIVLLAVIIGGIGGGVGAVFSFFSTITNGVFEFFTGHEYTVTDTETFLKNPYYGIPVERQKEIEDIYELTRDKLKYHHITGLENPSYEFDLIYFKLINDTTPPSPITPNTEGTKWSIKVRFYTEEEMFEVIQPLFYAKILTDYNLKPDEEEAVEALKEICGKVFDHDIERSISVCEGEVGACGVYHPKEGECPTLTTKIHDVFTCETCCKYVCNGHYAECEHNCNNVICIKLGCTHVHDESCGVGIFCENPIECETRELVCEGNTYCGTHQVGVYVWNMSDIEYFYEEYFEIPIAELESIEERDQSEEDRLTLLKLYYDILKLYMEEYGTEQ